MVVVMNEKIEVRLNDTFKDDIETAANERNQSMSEFLREAARRELQNEHKAND